jgi:hypothetical protein
MLSKGGETDEDRQIARLRVHRDLVGWIINKLQAAGVQAKRTTGGDANGDIEISDRDTIPQVKETLCKVREKLNSALTAARETDEEKRKEKRSYLEVKAYTNKKVDSTLARKLIQKETIFGIVTTGKITKPAKELFDNAEIIWIEEFPESQLNPSET